MMLVDQLPASTSWTNAIVVHALAAMEYLCFRGLQTIKHRRLDGYGVAGAMIDLHYIVRIKTARSAGSALQSLGSKTINPQISDSVLTGQFALLEGCWIRTCVCLP